MNVCRIYKTQLVIVLLFTLNLISASPGSIVAQDREQGKHAEEPPTLGLDEGLLELETPHFNLKLVRSSQTIASLQPKGEEGFDFTPADWLERRNGDGFFHLGDINLRLRMDDESEWKEYSTATARKPVETLEISQPVLAASDLEATLPDDIPLQIRRYWETTEDGNLSLRFELRNISDRPVEVGALGIPMIFNNILTGRDLDEAHAVCSFYDPYIGQDAGYLQVTRLNGHGLALLVVPRGDTPFEAYNPLLSDPTPRGITFEGFYEWMVHSKAYTEDEWSKADPWNPPTSEVLEPGESRNYGVTFLLSDTIRNIEETLIANNRPVAVGIPGYVLPKDQNGQLFIKYGSNVRSMSVEPVGALEISEAGITRGGWQEYSINGTQWGRARLTITYEDGRTQSVHYKVIKPGTEVVDDLGNFLTTEQWSNDPGDLFGRSPSVISYDYDEKKHVTEDSRAWIAGLSDEGGAGSWLAAIMKQLIRPDKEEISKLQRFVDQTLWGGIQYSEGEHKYGVRKSLFYYEPDEMPEGTYSSEIDYSGWSGWSREEAESVVRSYNYPHVAAAHWVLYRLARNYEGLVTNHPPEWYLERAYETSRAMVEHAPRYAQYGQMEGTVFLLILKDLQREGWTKQAGALEAIMRKRAELWRSLGFPFGSEMPWDSTGQEEVYAWCRYFGFDEKAAVTLNAILAYMPTVPHWGYNGSARRYWDFIYAGKLRRLERQLHHYGSGLNAIPVLTEYRDHPDDFYLLRVGYGGLMGSISNITQDGFGPSGFHAFPSTLRIDGYSGDYGPNFFGHAVNTGTYVTEHPEFGWLAFGGNLGEDGKQIRVKPLDSARSRIYLAPAGLWLTLEAGMFESITFNTDTRVIRLELKGGVNITPNARLRIEQPAKQDKVGKFKPSGKFAAERGAYVIPFKDGKAMVELRAE